jgi:hypothetical protein
MPPDPVPTNVPPSAVKPLAAVATPSPAALSFPWRGWMLLDREWKPGTVMAPAAPVGSGGLEGVFTFACDDGSFAMPSVRDVRHGAKPADLPQIHAFGAAGGKRHQLVIRAEKSLVVTPGGRIIGRYGGDEDGLKLARAHFAKVEPELSKKMAEGAVTKSA